MPAISARASAPSLLRHLLLLVGVLVIPLATFAVLVVMHHARTERRHVEAHAGDLARDLLAAVDRDLAIASSGLTVLAASRDLRGGNLSRFHSEAVAVAGRLGGSVALRTERGTLVLTTDRPFGEPLPSTSSPVMPRDVPAGSIGATVSDLIRGAVSGELVVRLSVPVPYPLDGDALHDALALDLVVDPRRVSRSLAGVALPEGWLAAVVDRTGRVIGRSARHEEFVGRGATRDFLTNTLGRTGTWHGTTIEGDAVFGAYARSDISGWRVGIGVPKGLVEAPLRRALLWFTGAGAIALLLALGGAVLLARRLACAIGRLTRMASALGRGEIVAVPPSGLREADAVAAAMGRASGDLAARLDALVASETRFRGLAEALPGLVFVADAGGANTYVNATFASYTGRPLVDLLGDGWTGVIHPDDLPGTAAAWHGAVHTGEPYEVTSRIRSAGGGFRWFLVRGRPVRDSDGRIDRWVGTCTDMDDVVAAREVLARSRAELEATVVQRTADLVGRNAELRAEIERRERVEAELSHARRLEAIGRLTGGVAHDFNNLLQVVESNAALLAELPETRTEAAAELLGGVRDAAARGASLVSHMLSFARRQDLRPKPVDVPDLLRRARPLLAQAAGTRGSLVLSFAADLPLARVDPDQLGLALLNLVTNARDARAGAIRIEARSAHLSWGDRPVGIARGDYLVLSVVDNGAGMDAATLARAMEPFFTTKGVGKGTGLGLAMVHGLAEQSGGALLLRSEADRGTVAELWLPREPEEALAAGTPAPKAETGNEGEAPVEGDVQLRVLLVDDDPLVLRVTAAMLRHLGHHPVTAEGGEEALALLEGSARLPDLVVTDYAMPGMTGVALAGHLRELRPALPVILATGYAELGEEDVELAASLPRLIKPYPREALARAIRAATHLPAPAEA